MTVMEAFAKAGHPVPEGALVYMNERHTWQCRRTKTKHRNGELTSYYYVWRPGRWECTGVGRGFRCDIALSNLPAADAYDALPECVRKVVER